MLSDFLKKNITSKASFVEYGYGQVEPNHLSAQRTGQIYAQLPALNERLSAMMRSNGCSEEHIANNQLDLRDLLTVASLIEEETSSALESPTIASVIYNRLCSKRYPCLNIDATVQYVLPERKDILTNADKAVISPYNTYTNAGLPAGPISNPGINSIRAALYPADTTYYFYALDPAGFNHFSSMPSSFFSNAKEAGSNFRSVVQVGVASSLSLERNSPPWVVENRNPPILVSS